MYDVDEGEFVDLRLAWSERMLTLEEAFRLRDMEDILEKEFGDEFERVTPARKKEKS